MNGIDELAMRSPDLGHLNLNLLVALDALLDTRNVRRAAERCGVTQSAMSHTLRQLRELFDDALLVRAGNQMLPTPRAESLVQPLRKALLAIEGVLKAEASFEPRTATRRFSIAASDAVAVTALPAFLALLAKEAPSVDVDVVPVERERAAAQLESGELDVLLVPVAPEGAGLRSRALYPTELAVVLRADHPAVGARLDLDTYCALPHALISVTGRGPGLVDELLAKRGRTRRIALRIPYFLAAPALLAHTDLVLTAPRKAAEHFARPLGLRVVPAPIPLPRGKISMVWHERYESDVASRWLRDAIVRATAALRGPKKARR